MPSPVRSVVVVGDNNVGIFVGCRGLWLVLHVYVGPGSLGTVCVGQGGFPLLCFWRSRGVDTARVRCVFQGVWLPRVTVFAVV